MSLVVFILLGGSPSALDSKNNNIEHSTQTFQPKFSMLAMLLGTDDICHFIPLLVTLSLPGDLKVNTMRNLLDLFSDTHFS